MIPSDLSLPVKFTSFRPGQAEAVCELAASDKRFSLVSLPTGGGKSLIAMALSRLLDARTLYVTGTKGLQHQVMTEFAAMGLVDIRGQNNYQCVALNPGGELSAYGHPSSCGDGPCHVGVKCSLRVGGCTYYDAVRRAGRASLVITNYAYWMTNNRYADPESLGAFDLLILDEAHSAPDALADFCSIRIDRADVTSLLEMRLPPLDDAQESWVDWAKVAVDECRRRWVSTKEELSHPLSDKRSLSRRLRRLTDLGRGLKELANAHKWRRGEPAAPDVWIPGAATDWVAEKTDDGALFSPVWAHAYAEEYLFKGIPRIVLLSATLQPAVGRYLGIRPDASEFREFASTFDPRRRPVVWVPTTRVDRNMTEGQVRVWVNRIDALIDRRLDRKGIVHTRSYDRARVLLERSRHSRVMLTHTTRTTRDVVERFKRASAPCVLVSPAVSEGFDFPYSECAYQIIAKVPFVDSRSPLLQARHRSDKTYINYLTALELIQQCGRGMRAADDTCENLIVDDHIEWFWPAANKQKLFPDWFKRAYRRTSGIPEPAFAVHRK